MEDLKRLSFREELRYSPQEISELQNEVEELNSLFKTIQTLSQEQDAQLGLVDEEVEEISKEVEVASSQLVIAKKSDKRTLYYSLALVGLSIPISLVSPLVGIPVLGLGLGLYRLRA